MTKVMCVMKDRVPVTLMDSCEAKTCGGESTVFSADGFYHAMQYVLLS